MLINIQGAGQVKTAMGRWLDAQTAADPIGQPFSIHSAPNFHKASRTGDCPSMALCWDLVYNDDGRRLHCVSKRNVI
jgi:hypothetical protein